MQNSKKDCFQALPQNYPYTKNPRIEVFIAAASMKLFHITHPIFSDAKSIKTKHSFHNETG